METVLSILYLIVVLITIAFIAGIGCYFGVKVAAKELREVFENITFVSNNNISNVNFEDKEQVEEFYSALKKYVEDETNIKNHS